MRNRLFSLLAFLSVSAVLLAPVQADLIWVPWQVTDLQDAIDMAAPGDVIHIDGGTHAPIVIDKPLTLVGTAGNKPFVRAPSFLESGDACIQLAGPGSGVVTLSSLETGGVSDGQAFSFAHSGISGSGFSQLHITHCEINTPEWIWPTGIGDGGSAIEIDIPLLVVQDSTVIGGAGTDDGSGLSGGYTIPKAGHGIDTKGDVLMQDSSVQGGAGYSQVLNDPQLCPPPCSLFSGGHGGTGLRAKVLWAGANTIVGGEGGVVICPSSASCVFPDGEALDIQQLVNLEPTLVAGGPIKLGQVWSLDYAVEPALPAYLVYSLFPSPPYLISEGYFFMNPVFYRLRVLPVPGSGMGNVLFAVPADWDFVGLTVVFQTWQPGIGLSSPMMATATWY